MAGASLKNLCAGMESSFSAASTVTIEELLRLRSPISSHNHISSYKRKRSQRTSDEHSKEEDTGFKNSFSLLGQENHFVWDGTHLVAKTGDVDAGKVQSSEDLLQEKRIPEAMIPLSKNPLLLLGWIQLWNDSLHLADWLAFSDHSGTISCVVRDVDPHILGCPVRLLSWSYIPDRYTGGCIEVRLFEKAEMSSLSNRSCFRCPETANVPNLVLETPPSKRNRKSRLALSGRVIFISPPFAMPHGESRSVHEGRSSKEQNAAQLQNVFTLASAHNALLGFFLGLSACNHNPSCSSTRLEHCNIVGCAGCVHCEPSMLNLSYVYFSGSPAAWRPILLRVFGRCISISGLRKKILLDGKEQSQYCVYAATRTCGVCINSNMDVLKTSLDHFTQSSCLMETHQQQKRLKYCEHQDVGSYVGVVSEIFLRGGLLELDGCIWLLLTHQPLSQVPGLRVGAVVAACHVHFLKVTSFFEKALVLGACSRTHVVVTHFSPLKTSYAGKRESRSRLSHFVELLPFLPAFWALQVIASFRQKFQGIFSNKEILGSGKNTGIVEAYLKSLLGGSNDENRNVLEEFFSHSNACTLNQCFPSNFSLQVPPIRNFCKQIEIMWLDQSSSIWSKHCREVRREYELHMSGAKGSTFYRRVISSDILGVTILGFLEYSPAGGKLQLVDATGALDVIIPDLHTIECFQGLCQVTSYKLVIEGYSTFQGVNLNAKNIPMSSFNILRGTSFNIKASSQFSLFLTFFMKEALFLHNIKHINFVGRLPGRGDPQQMLPFFDIDGDDLWGLDVLFVLHTFPKSFKSFGKQTEGISSSFYMEAVKLPYSICLFNGQRAISPPKQAAEILTSSDICRAFVLSLSVQAQNVLKKPTNGSNGASFTYISYPSLFKKNESTMKRHLFQFHGTPKQAFKIIEIGCCYVVKTFPDHGMTSVHSESKFWSLAVEVDHGTGSEGDMVQEVLFKSGSARPLVDVVLKLPPNMLMKFDSAVEDARASLVPVLSVGEVLDLAKSLNNWEDSTHTGLWKGSLISLYGKVVESVDTRQCRSYSLASSDQNSCGSNVFFVKDLNSSLLVTVYCDPDEQCVPVGFSPGAIIMVHRGLLQLSAYLEVTIRCIPSTLIEVRYVGEDSFAPAQDNCTETGKFRDHADVESAQRVPTLIGTLPLEDSMVVSTTKLVCVQCRVLSVERLLIERDKILNRCLSSSEAAIYRVRHVSLTVDDGSGLASCCARDEAAAGLLDLPLQKGHHFSSEGNGFLENMHVVRELNTITKKYGTILFHSINCEAEPWNENFVVRGAGDQGLECREKKFIYGIVQRACNAGPLDIVAKQCIPKDCIEESWKGQWKNSDTRDLQSFPCPLLVAIEVRAAEHEKQLATTSKSLLKMLKNIEDGVT